VCEARNLSICFIDSSKYLVIKLSSLPYILGMEGRKGYSPNSFSTDDLQKTPELLLPMRSKNFEGVLQIIQEWVYGDNPVHIL